ncbi:unnamed protein product, partial [Rotaria sp. Silwood2]
INILQLFRHENIIQFYGCVEYDGTYYIYLECVAGGALLIKIERYGSLPEGVVQYFFKQLICEMAYIHSLDVVHRV